MIIVIVIAIIVLVGLIWSMLFEAAESDEEQERWIREWLEKHKDE